MSKKIQTEYYKDFSKIYDSKQKRENRNHLNKLKAIWRDLHIKPNAKILEIGVGTGIHAKYLQEWGKGKNLELYGVDLSDDMLEKARERLGDSSNMKLKAMDAHNLEFPDNYFDGIFMAATLHHLDDCEKGIDEVVRCLKPGGYFSLMEPNLYWPKNLYQGLFIPAEKNQMLIKKKNFRSWLNKHKNVKYEIINMAYTPPWPKSLIPFFDKVDQVLTKTPLLKNLSIQLYVRGKKL